jgi:hypothetical protein
MRPFTLSNVAALAAGQLLGILSACASTYGVWLWLWLAAAHPFR